MSIQCSVLGVFMCRLAASDACLANLFSHDAVRGVWPCVHGERCSLFVLNNRVHCSVIIRSQGSMLMC
jgi:hypothetical protein